MEDEDATVWLDDNNDPNSSSLFMEVEEVEASCTTEVEEDAIDCMVDADLVTAPISSIFSSNKASNWPEFTIEDEDS